jgi:hypothetical protein
VSFPVQYKSKIIFLKDDFINNQISIDELYKALITGEDKTKPESSKFKYKESVTILNLEYDIEIRIKKYKEEIILTYEINLEKVVRLIFLLIIFFAFFLFFSINYFLIFSTIIAFSVYTTIVLVIKNKTHLKIKKSFSEILLNQTTPEVISEEQKQWMNDETVCSGCGTRIGEFDTICSECGLNLNIKKQSLPYNITKFQEEHIRYHIKKN